MKKAALILMVLHSFYSFAACEPQKDTVTVPFEAAREACFKTESSLSIMPDGSQFEISPSEITSKNIPDFKVSHFINVEFMDEDKGPVVQIVSFFCSQELPVGGDAISVNLATLQAEKNEGVIISTGSISDTNSNELLKMKARIFDHFGSLYEDKAQELLDDDREDVFIPAIFNNHGSRFSSSEKKVLSFFLTKTGSSINGCSGKFQAIMKDHLLENVSGKDLWSGIQIKKKLLSKKYKLSWQ